MLSVVFSLSGVVKIVRSALVSFYEGSLFRVLSENTIPTSGHFSHSLFLGCFVKVASSFIDLYENRTFTTDGGIGRLRVHLVKVIVKVMQ